MAPRLPPARCSAAGPFLCAVSTDAQYPGLLVSAHWTTRWGLSVQLPADSPCGPDTSADLHHVCSPASAHHSLMHVAAAQTSHIWSCLPRAALQLSDDLWQFTTRQCCCPKPDSSHCLQQCAWACLPRQWRRLRLAQGQQRGPQKRCPPVCPSFLSHWCEQLPAQIFHTQHALHPCKWSAAAYRFAFCNRSVST